MVPKRSVHLQWICYEEPDGRWFSDIWYLGVIVFCVPARGFESDGSYDLTTAEYDDTGLLIT
jgi:hypothetical protein